MNITLFVFYLNCYCIRMNGKIISSTQRPDTNELSYRVEIFEDEGCSELVGEANVIGSSSFSRDRQFMTKTMIKRYAKSVANRRGPSFPWFIPDDLAKKYGITTDLPTGITADMKPTPHSAKVRGSSSMKIPPDNQMSIDEYFLNSNPGFLADERSVSPPPPQFTFPCDDAVVPIELIDSELSYPELVPMNQFISSDSDDNLLSRSLSVWSFCQNFSSQLKLSPFPYDDWEEALTCMDPLLVDSNPIIEETFLALLFGFMKDRRNLTKAAYSDRLKSVVLTFKPEPRKDEQDEAKDNAEEVVDDKMEVDSAEDVEITISSDEDEESTFVKRPRKSNDKDQGKKAKFLLLPSIDLKKHRWYENRALEYWHFVLGSFLLEVIEMIEICIDDENVKAEAAAAREREEAMESSSDESNKSDVDVGDDSEYEEGKSTSGNDEMDVDESSDEGSPPVKVKQFTSGTPVLEVLETFVSVYAPIVERLTGRGSKEMFTTYLSLSLSDKMALLDFLVHSHYDREPFKASVEDSLERQGESRRLRKEIELELKSAQKELEDLEESVQKLKDLNVEITEKLEAEESDIELSEAEVDKAEEVKVAFVPLTDEERDELINVRAGNKKEISTLNASCRRIRPEVTALQRKFDAASRDLRKCSSYRTISLGSDRQFREYWWFGEFLSPLCRLLIFDPMTKKWLGCIDSPAAFSAFMDWLNPLGIREAKLKTALLEIEEDLSSSLEARDLPIEKVATIPSNATEDDEEEIDFEAFKKTRGRPAKGSTSNNTPLKRPFQRYKNTL